MSEDISHKPEGELPNEDTTKKVTRRSIVRGGIGAFTSYLAGRTGYDILDHIRNAPAQKESTPEPEELETVTPTPHVETPVSEDEDAYYDGLSPEHKQLVDETSKYLTKLYGEHMSEQYYPSEADKVRFWKEVTQMGIRMNPDNPNLGNQLAAVMAFETAGKFSPDVVNANGSEAMGLIQFMPRTAENLGTSLEELKQMTPHEQLPYVEEYFKSQKAYFGGEYFSVDDVYMAVFAPDAISKGPNDVLYTPGSKESNRNLVIDRIGGNGDGVITKIEATKSVIMTAAQMGERLEYLRDPRQQNTIT